MTNPVHLTGAHRNTKNVQVVNDAQIIVTQAFGPRGDNLVGLSGVEFDGFPAVTVGVQLGELKGLVHLSPIHGDDRKAGFLDFPEGARLTLFCPVSGLPLPQVGEGEGEGVTYHALYLTPSLEKGSTVVLSNVWGHYHSRIIDEFELISSWGEDEG